MDGIGRWGSAPGLLGGNLEGASMRSVSRLLPAIIAACLACGDRTSLDSDPRADAAGTSVTLMIPLGSYSGCSSTMVTVGPNFEGVSGGDGSITLAQEGDGIVAATLAFTLFASGKVAFTPTSGSSAAFAAGKSFDVDTIDFHSSNVTVAATTGALVLVDDTMFISVHGKSVGADEVSGYFHCPVPASLAPTSIVTNAAPGAPLTAGVYGPCTSTVSSLEPVSVLAGGSGTVTITKSAGTMSAAWNDMLTPVCGSLAFGATSGSVATLAAGQTCTLQGPCGPPPSLGPSPVPMTATLTNTAGSMTVDAHSLFIDVVGDTTTLTCGRHYVSIICAASE
jgi:hypothetical protein